MPNGELQVDYKVLVLNGRAHYVSVFLRGIGKPFRWITFDREWGVVPLHLPTHPADPRRGGDGIASAATAAARRVAAVAAALAEDYPFERAFYVVDEVIYFGEPTFLPSARYAPFSPVAYDQLLGDMVDVGSPRTWWTRGGGLRTRP